MSVVGRKATSELSNPRLFVSMPDPPDYDQFVDHPRFGRRPRVTGLNPGRHDAGVHLHWNALSDEELAADWKRAFGTPWIDGDLRRSPGRIPNTAIAADLGRQTPATCRVTHYFDVQRVCRGCLRPNALSGSRVIFKL